MTLTTQGAMHSWTDSSLTTAWIAAPRQVGTAQILGEVFYFLINLSNLLVFCVRKIIEKNEKNTERNIKVEKL